MDLAREENEALKEKINGLKQQYGPIGSQVLERIGCWKIILLSPCKVPMACCKRVSKLKIQIKY